GVDGGAPSTALAMCDREGRVLGIGHGGPSNHILAPGGEERARSAVLNALNGALAAAGLDRPAFEAAQFGMTGISRDSEPGRAFAAVVAPLLTTRIMRIESDASVALAGALACRPGVAVMAGTASAAVATARAAAGDPVAVSLANTGAEGLAAIASAVVRRLTWPDGTAAVAPVGGVFKAGPVILAPLKAAIAARAPSAVLVPPRFEP